MKGSEARSSGLLEFAVEMAQVAGKNSLSYFGPGMQDPQVEYKEDDSPVTVADRSSELLMRSRIQERFPAHGILGEEFPEVAPKPGQPRWILDPIDGTRAFVAGVPLYTVLVALVDEDGPTIGVIHNPVTEETVAALAGGGCYFNGSSVRLQGSSEEQGNGSRAAAAGPAAATICCTDFGELSRRRPALLSHIAQVGYTARTWADAYGYLLLVTGRIQAMIDPVMNSWDIAPMYPIVEEAGGVITTLAGDREPLGDSALASTAPLHASLLRAAQS